MVLSSSDVFALKVIFTIIIFLKLFLIGFLKGNGIEVNNVQFPEVFAAYKEMVEKLGIKNHLSSTQAAVCYRTVAYAFIRSGEGFAQSRYSVLNVLNNSERSISS